MNFTHRRNFVGNTLSLVFLSFLISFAIASSLSSASSSALKAAASPAANGELICHTDNPAECYPKVFSPTEEFQIVHDDQDLPSGLHVRLNIWTGEKEARLNIDNTHDPALEGLPVEQAVVVVDPQLSQDEPQIPAGAPAYEPVGIVKEPEVQDPDFLAALDFIKVHAETTAAEKHPLDEALADLEDLSHDIYYGKKITEDAEALKSLFCLLTERDTQQLEARALSERRDFLASSILASSLQNNPPALRNVESHWDVLNQKCGFHSEPLREVLLRNLEPRSSPGTHEYKAEAAWARTTLPVVGKLLKSGMIRVQFMERDGMRNFLQILLAEGQEWEAARARVSRIVGDTFLDETVGASLGLWPLGAVSDKAVCTSQTTSLSEGCWEFHLGEIIKQRPEAEWAQDLLSLLKQVRPVETARVREL
ncbi:hypothetical protein BX600DRAFT_507971 [Xylariales sp. PMI_506]|nr:hypothetical protein BX600DRAFT_507971 [Xylariales sp. PMI_506]